MIIGVLLPLPLEEPFDYKSQEALALGTIVRVPWGKGCQVGVVWKHGKTSTLEDEKIKPILEVISLPPIKKPLRDLVTFMADYNIAPLGLALKTVISVKQVFEDERVETLYTLSGKTLSEAKLKNSDARWRVLELLKHYPYSKAEICKGAGVTADVVRPLIEAGVLSPIIRPKQKEFSKPRADFQKINLTPEQQAAAACLRGKIGSGFSVTLIDGVTGSGKTEVYFDAAAKVIEKGRQVLILVPEISLTAQWLNRFEKRFGIKPACWHSNLGTRERIETWVAAAEGRAQVIVGARSALFLPYADLGLIVIDESHDHSFKQEDLLNYQCRDMAVVRAKLENFPLVLSTATPDLETLVNVENRKYDMVELKKRFAGAELPQVKIIDLRKDKPQKGSWGPAWLSPSLVGALRNNLEKGGQSMLFLNRRGYAPLVICRDCGHRIQCPHCTAWLAEHRTSNRLICHQCGYTMSGPKRCPDCCSEDGLTSCGPGVERIAEEVRARFPTSRIAVLSSDITSRLKEISEIFDQMERGELDIIIGTQILAKGHHFPELTLVGIVDADLGLMGSDLRAAERTFQLLSQVSGRAGRAGKAGEVYLQTLYPENLLLKALCDNDRSTFVDLEKKTRKMLKMPPYGKLAALIVSGENKELVERIATALGQIAPNNQHMCTLGPAPAPIFMLRNKYRFRLLLKTSKGIKIQDIVKRWIAKVNVPPKVRVEVDIDPYSFM